MPSVNVRVDVDVDALEWSGSLFQASLVIRKVPY